MPQFFQCLVFRGLSTEVVESLLEGRFALDAYRPGTLVATQGTRYESLLIVSEGALIGEMTDALGRTTVIEEIHAPRAVAPAFLFATDNRLPVTLKAVGSTVLAAIPRRHFMSLMQQNEVVLSNFLTIMSDRSRFLSDKLHTQRFGSIRSNLVRYLFDESKQHAGSNFFTISETHQQLADRFGVTRPALSRCIAQLNTSGIIHSRRNEFVLLDEARLKALLRD